MFTLQNYLKMAVAQVSASLSVSIRGTSGISSPATPSPARLPVLPRAFTGSPLVIRRAYHQRRAEGSSKALSIRSEQNTKAGGLDVWLSRFGMVGFTAAIGVEIATGKGLLENFGLTSPLPTVALGVTALVGVLTAIFIFQSGSES